MTLPASLQESCAFKLVQIELHFRLAQAEDSLSELHHLLQITMSLRNYKLKQVRASQQKGTRARTLINQFKDKVSRCVERYRAAYKALCYAFTLSMSRANLFLRLNPYVYYWTVISIYRT